MSLFQDRFIVIILSSLLLISNIFPGVPERNIGSIGGKVSAYSSGEALAGANVFIMNSAIGTSTDQNGNFELNDVPAGLYVLVVSYIGFQSRQQNITLRAGQFLQYDFRLQPSILETGAIVVTGTATPYLYEEAPVKTEVIPRRLIEQTQSCNLAEALALQTGVRVENNCQNCNFTQVRILGFDGKYTQVLIDGDPVVSTLAGVYALEQFPDEMIGQIEIVKGGGSALYGGGAMAGTINLRTSPPALNRSRVSYEMQSLDAAIDQRIGVVSELVSGDGKSGTYIFGAVRNRDHYDYNGDGYSEMGLLKHESIGLNWYFRPLTNSELQATFHRINEDRRGGNDFDRPEHEADIAESLHHERWGGKLRWVHQINNNWNYQGYYSFSLLNRESYYGGLGGNTYLDSLQALEYYGKTSNRTQVSGLHSTYTLKTHNFTFGGQYSRDYLGDRSVKDARYYINNTYINSGVFFQDDFTLFHERLNIVAGARFDKQSVIDHPVFSPRLNIKYILAHDLNLRAAFTTGFKAPQTFDEDLHIESLGGEQRVVRNADNLSMERIQSWTASLDYEGNIGSYLFLAGVTGFYSRLQDAYSEVELDNSGSDLILWQRINSDGAKLFGLETDLGFKPTINSELRLGLTYKKAVFESEQEIFSGVTSDKFLRSPDIHGVFRASWDVTKGLNLFGSVVYTGVMYVPNEANQTIIKTKTAFYEVDAGTAYEFGITESLKTKVSVGVKNIANAYQRDLQSGVDRDPAYVYGPQLPRRFYMGINFAF